MKSAQVLLHNKHEEPFLSNFNCTSTPKLRTKLSSTAQQQIKIEKHRPIKLGSDWRKKTSVDRNVLGWKKQWLTPEKRSISDKLYWSFYRSSQPEFPCLAIIKYIIWYFLLVSNWWRPATMCILCGQSMTPIRCSITSFRKNISAVIGLFLPSPRSTYSII